MACVMKLTDDGRKMLSLIQELREKCNGWLI